MTEPFCCACLVGLKESNVVKLSKINDEELSLTYADCIKICTNVELDGSHNICESCTLELQTSYSFYRRINESQRVLKELESKSTADSDSRNTLVVEFSEVTEEDEDVEFEMLEFDYQLGEHAMPKEGAEIETLRIASMESPKEEFNIEPEAFENPADSDNSDYNEAEVISNDKETEIENWKPSAIPTDEVSMQKIEIMPVECKDASDSKTNPTPSNSEKPRTRYFGQFSCDYCDKLFPNHSRMILHRRSHEPDRPKFACSECGRIYCTNQALEVHIRAVHEMSGHTCKICSKVFAVKASLTVHMRFHTGNFPYVCETCGHKFAQLCHLKTHRNVKHNSVRFCCNHPNCSKFFTSSASLRNHEFSHGLMPFECEFCHRGYPSKSKLKVHVRKAHKKDLTLEELEPMRRFHVMRSKPKVMQVTIPALKKTSSAD